MDFGEAQVARGRKERRMSRPKDRTREDRISTEIKDYELERQDKVGKGAAARVACVPVHSS